MSATTSARRITISVAVATLILTGACSSSDGSGTADDAAATGRTQPVAPRCTEEATPQLPRQGTPEHLLVADATALTPEDRLVLMTLQGNVNRNEPRIYVLNGTGTESGEQDGQGLWLDDYERRYGITSEPAPPLPELVETFADELDGVVVVDPDLADSTNLATTLAGLRNALAVHPQHLDDPVIADLPVIEDLRGRWSDADQMYDWMIEELWEETPQQAVAVLHPDTLDGWLGPQGGDMRDYLVANRILVVWGAPAGAEKARLERMMEALPDDLPVLGYPSADGAEELAGQTLLSERNKWLVPTHNTRNLSVHSGVPADVERLRELAAAAEPAPALTDDEIASKLIVTAAFSDYDNLRLPVDRGRLRWEEESRGQVPASWGMPGTALELAPGVVEHYYETRSPNDSFVLATSLGYITPALYPNLDAIAAETTRHMCELGLDAMWPLDHNGGLATFSDDYRASLVPFTEGFDMRGIFLNYYENGVGCAGVTGPSRVPFCYTASNWNGGDGEITRSIEQALAERQEGEPAFLFLGLNGWDVGPDRLVAELGALSPEDRAQVRWVTQAQFFDGMRHAFRDRPADEPLVADATEDESGSCDEAAYHHCVPCPADEAVEVAVPRTIVADPLAGTVEQPAAMASLLGGLLPPGSIPPLLIELRPDADADLTALGGFGVTYEPPVTQDPAAPTFEAAVDWSCNPYIDLTVERVQTATNGFDIVLEDVQLTGRLDADGNLVEGTIGGVLDPTPLAEQLGVDPCEMLAGLCGEDGGVELKITGLSGTAQSLPLTPVP